MSDFEITESVDVVKGGGGEVWFDGATVTKIESRAIYTADKHTLYTGNVVDIMMRIKLEYQAGFNMILNGIYSTRVNEPAGIDTDTLVSTIQENDFNFNFFHSQLSDDVSENYEIEVTDTSVLKLFDSLPVNALGGKIWLANESDAIAMMEDYQAALGRNSKNTIFSKTLRNKVDKAIRDKAIKFLRR